MEAAVKDIQTTGTPIASLAEQAKIYISKTGGSIAAVAKDINCSRTKLSRYLGGKYDSDVSDLEQDLARYLETKTGKVIEFSAAQQSGSRPDWTPHFYGSRDAKNILGVCQSCQEYIGLGIVVGRSGYGKTHTLKEYAQLPRVVYIECDDTMSSRDLVEAIERALGIPNSYGTIWRRVNGIREFFNANKGYLLLIDEADKLVSKYTQKKMEILRSIFDQSDVGLVIAGEPKLEAQIKTYLTRMANRVDFYASLRGLSKAEVNEYLIGFDITPHALAELQARACNMQNGCFRLLDRTLSNVRRILKERNATTVTSQIIEQASAMMML